MKTLILSAHYAHAQRLANELGLYPRAWLWVDDVQKLRGLPRGGVLIEMETANWRTNYYEIKTEARARELQVVEISLDRLLGVTR